MAVNMLATVLLASVIGAPPASLAFHSGDRPEASVGPSIILVDENDYVIDLAPLSPNASYDDCVRYVTDKCGEKYRDPDSSVCTSQYLMTCMER